MTMQDNLEWIRNNKTNKSTAFTAEEKKQLGIEGLFPFKTSSQDLQVKRVLQNLDKKPSSIEKYLYLSALQSRNERLFYRVINEDIETLLPIIYTPTVGEACKSFSHVYTEAKGFYITKDLQGRIGEVLDNWPSKNIKVIVVTDGERILGLGDLGANGMGIPIGKLVLYSACGGIDPSACLPIMIDVGTNNEELLNDPLYLGVPQPRISGTAYFELLDELMEAVTKKYPEVLVQFEDFLTPNAFALLHRYQFKYRCFNDDIQGTAAVALAGIICSTRITEIPLTENRFLFLGGGSAATGIADLLVNNLVLNGLSIDQALERISICDIQGLMTTERTDLQPHNLPYAKPSPAKTFLETVQALKPTVLIGATGAGGAFTQEIIEAMSAINLRPVIFALSNPTSKAECTAEQAYTWSKGKAVFVSGSPFNNVVYEGKTFDPGQGNNAYIFPGLGLGMVAGNIKHVNDELLITAAKCLANLVENHDLDLGALYPPIQEIRSVSLTIAKAVMLNAVQQGLSSIDPSSIDQRIQDELYDPRY
ncbi:MAG: NAD-dependent malic enzyme [Bacteroidetes bacterium]|nr:NAD-dependent malic enzyme [Bacteroidota bacterium]MBM3424634.1 NAD-dependent malic enzyme [Bacteroidota bacterium]